MCKLPKDRWSNCGIAHQQNHCFIRQGATRAHSHVVFSWITQCQHKILGTNWDFVSCLLLKKMNNKSSISVIYWLCQWTQRNKKIGSEDIQPHLWARLHPKYTSFTSWGIFVNRTARTLGPGSSKKGITHKHNYLQSKVPVLSSNTVHVDHSDWLLSQHHPKSVFTL